MPVQSEPFGGSARDAAWLGDSDLVFFLVVFLAVFLAILARCRDAMTSRAGPIFLDF